jgi:hypothetical protein
LLQEGRSETLRSTDVAQGGGRPWTGFDHFNKDAQLDWNNPAVDS